MIFNLNTAKDDDITLTKIIILIINIIILRLNFQKYYWAFLEKKQTGEGGLGEGGVEDINF